MTDQEQGVVSSVVGLSKSIVTTLPPAFLMLLLLNIAFIGIVFWFLDDQMASRMAMLNKIIDHCLTK